MAYEIESGLPDLFNQLGSEIKDLTLSEGADGKRVSKAWAVRELAAATREVFRRLRKHKVDPLHFKQVFSLTVSGSDAELYPLNRRVRQIMRVFDEVSSTNQQDYWPLSLYDLSEQGWVLEPEGLRLRNATLIGTLKCWAVQTPARPSYGTAAAAAGTSITLATTPDIGATSIEPHYYVGARIGIESATTGAGQVRRISAYDASTRVCTVATWDTTPTGTIKYSILLDLPDCMDRAVVLRAALIILRADESMDRELDDVAASYREAFEGGKSLLLGAKIGHIPQLRSTWDSGFASLN